MIEWTEQAARQLQHVRDYISLSTGDEVAERITDQILVRLQQLELFPMSGRVGRVAGVRELVISGTPFLAAYTMDGERIVILALYHGAQKWPESF